MQKAALPRTGSGFRCLMPLDRICAYESAPATSPSPHAASPSFQKSLVLLMMLPSQHIGSTTKVLRDFCLLLPAAAQPRSRLPSLPELSHPSLSPWQLPRPQTRCTKSPLPGHFPYSLPPDVTSAASSWPASGHMARHESFRTPDFRLPQLARTFVSTMTPCEGNLRLDSRALGAVVTYLVAQCLLRGSAMPMLRSR